MALGTFTLTIDGERQDGTAETKARLHLRTQGVDTLIDADADEFKFPTKFADSKGVNISLPYSLTLFTDSASGDSDTIGYEGWLSTDEGRIEFQFAAPQDGTNAALTDLTDEVVVPISSVQQFRDEAEAAQDAAEVAATSASSTALSLGSGRLSDDALTFAFRQERVFIPATQMAATSGTPVLNIRGGLWPCWVLDAATIESVGCTFTVPQNWATFDIIVRGVNVAAGTGNVVLRVQYSARADGDDVTAGFTSGSDTTFTAQALNIRQTVITTRKNLVADATKTHLVRVLRQASDAGDTLPNDWGITSIELAATSYVIYQPPAIGEPDAPAATGNAFSKADNADLGSVRVFQQAPPPADNTVDTSYSYWPVTDAATQQNFTTSTWTGGNRWAFHWSNRCNFGTAWNKKPNPLPAPSVTVGGRQCRTVFTTVDKANAATQSQIRYMLGGDATNYQAPWIAAGGSAGDFITDANYRANPATYFVDDFTHGSTIYKVTTDKVLLPSQRLVDGANASLQKGVVLDYECQDSRTAAQTTAFVNAVATDIHAAGKEMYLYTNPLNGPIQRYNGMDSTNLPTILGYVDYLSVLLWSGSTEGTVSGSYTNQIALLGTMTTPLWAKLVITFELGNPGTSLADAQWVGAKLREAGTTHPDKVMFWRNLAAAGGSATTLTNQKIAAVTGV